MTASDTKPVMSMSVHSNGRTTQKEERDEASKGTCVTALSSSSSSSLLALGDCLSWDSVTDSTTGSNASGSSTSVVVVAAATVAKEEHDTAPPSRGPLWFASLLNDDTLALILSFSDFASAHCLSCVLTTTTTNDDDNDNNDICCGKNDDTKDSMVEDMSTNDTASDSPQGCVDPYWHVWKDFFQRHCFSPEDVTTMTDTDITDTTVPTQQPPQRQQYNNSNSNVVMDPYKKETIYRRQLFENLMPRPKQHNMQKKKKSITQNPSSTPSPSSPPLSSALSLPYTHFKFLPIVPLSCLSGALHDDRLFFAANNDSPMVTFHCDSFCLTSTATSDEWILLDPLSGTLSIHETMIQHCEETTMMCTTKSLRKNPYHQGAAIANSNDIVIDDDDEEQAKMMMVQPKQELFTLTDSWNVSLHDYGFDPNTTTNNNDDDDDDELEVEIEPTGIDCKKVVNEVDGSVTGTMVAFARSINNATNGTELLNEVITWSKPETSPPQGKDTTTNADDTAIEQNKQYGDRRVCRLRRPLRVADICPKYARLYASFKSVQADDHAVARGQERQHGGVGANPNVLLHAGNNNNNQNDAEPAMRSDTGSSRIFVYPLVPYHENAKVTTEFFPSPDDILECHESITSLACPPTGRHVMVATVSNKIQIWNVAPTQKKKSTANFFWRKRSSTKPHLAATLSIEDELKAALGRKRNDLVRHLPSRMQRHAPIVSIVVCPHGTIEQFGFATLQHDLIEGNSVLLWSKTSDGKANGGASSLSSNQQYHIHGMINLPLLVRRQCRIHYDGRRLIVLGQDHIGYIILLYHVSTSREDSDCFGSETKSGGQTPRNVSAYAELEGSGGIISLNACPSVRFARRIRHAALGGVESYESIHMTCNERFIVVNTKAGSLLNETNETPYTDGLLVIDLDDGDQPK